MLKKHILFLCDINNVTHTITLTTTIFIGLLFYRQILKICTSLYQCALLVYQELNELYFDYIIIFFNFEKQYLLICKSFKRRGCKFARFSLTLA